MVRIVPLLLSFLVAVVSVSSACLTKDAAQFLNTDLTAKQMETVNQVRLSNDLNYTVV